jgi:hypothetical protein
MGDMRERLTAWLRLLPTGVYGGPDGTERPRLPSFWLVLAARNPALFGDGIAQLCLHGLRLLAWGFGIRPRRRTRQNLPDPGRKVVITPCTTLDDSCTNSPV